MALSDSSITLLIVQTLLTARLSRALSAQMNDSKPKCVLIPESKQYAKTVIRTIRFDEPDLIVELQGPVFSYARIVFREVIGYRVIDEREITEFWNDYSEPNGWLWEVLDGGWLSLERSRVRFNPLQLALREFFVVDNYCVNVLCAEPPELHDLGSNPEQESTHIPDSTKTSG